MDNYDRLAKESDIAGVAAVEEYLTDFGFDNQDYKIELSKDRYSVYDFILYIGDYIIPVEIKYRKKKYNTIMMEQKKAKALTAVKGTDHWYVNVFKDGSEPVIFSMNKLRNCEKIIKNEQISFADTDLAASANYILIANISANSNTAYNGEKILKRCWFFPIGLKINGDDNYID